jgi:hypothetical protein
MRFTFRDRRAMRAGAALLLFVYTLLVRTWGISTTFWLLRDQMRDWAIAIGPLRDLPLGGVPSNAGGTTLGPAYYWIVWVIGHTIGWFTGRLPHGGGIGVALLQSAADVVFFLALWKKMNSGWFAFAITLLVATQPFDMSVTAAMWNPAVALALVKITIALVLLGGESRSIWWTVGATATSWMAVQAHSTTLLLAAPLIASFTLREVLERRWRFAAVRLGASVAVVVVLQIPLLLNSLLHPRADIAPGKVLQSLVFTMSHPESFHVVRSFNDVASALESHLFSPVNIPWFGSLLLVATAVTAFRLRRDLVFTVLTVVPLAAFVAGFAVWQLPFDPYYCLQLTPSAALTLALALPAWPGSTQVAGIVIAGAMIVMQPSRHAYSMSILRFPYYGALAEGSREIRRRVDRIYSVTTEFPLPPTTSAVYLYEILGGRRSADAEYRATIGAQGDVRFDRVN